MMYQSIPPINRKIFVIPIFCRSHHIDIGIGARLGRGARLAQGFTDALRHPLCDGGENRAVVGVTVSGGREEAEEEVTRG
jgi:hypothetical protein